MSDLFEIRGVEIFGAGTHKGETYSIADLDAMVDAFGRVGFRVPIKLGHTPDEGAPAWGWVSNLRRVGAKLVADFVDMTREAYDLIRTRRYGQISIEIWSNLRSSAGVFRRVLKCAALLGSEIPSVPHLKPVWESLSAASFTCDGVMAYTTTWRWTGMESMNRDAAGQEVHRRTLGFAMENNLPYANALRMVLQEDADLARIYTGVPQEPQVRIAGEEVDARAKQRLLRFGMAETLQNYVRAVHEELAADPELARMYAEGEANRI